MTEPVWSVNIIIALGIVSITLYILDILIKASQENVSVQDKEH